MAKTFRYTILNDEIKFPPKKGAIPVFYSTDNNQSHLALVSMVSVMENTSQKVNFHILYSRLDEKSFAMLNSIKKYKNCTIEFKQVEESTFFGFKNAGWVTTPTWFRVLIPDLYPQYDKVIYLDCDTMLTGDISEYYDIDISKVLAAVVSDIWNNKSSCSRLYLKSGFYFNAGILLINAKKWRKLELFNQIREFAFFGDYKFGDQDVLNKVIDEDKLKISSKYDYIEPWHYNYYVEFQGEDLADWQKARTNALIVHFVSGYKPDKAPCRHSYKTQWWKYAKKTDYYLEFLDRYVKSANAYVAQLFKDGVIK